MSKIKNSLSLEQLDELSYSEEYSDYIMENCGGDDRCICNGDTLLEAMEDNYLFEAFVASFVKSLETGTVV